MKPSATSTDTAKVKRIPQHVAKQLLEALEMIVRADQRGTLGVSHIHQAIEVIEKARGK